MLEVWIRLPPAARLGELEAQVPGVYYGVRTGDRVALTDQHHEPGQERIENGSRGQVLDIAPDGGVLIKFDVTARKRTERPASSDKHT
ncbi:MAG TPA: hypothetical protein VK730_00035 [Solirubrobacteraceae bacterium]|nr:hypothetical protein [Solirubrobacteraceae bacterium]